MKTQCCPIKFLIITIVACAAFASCLKKTEIPPIYISHSATFVIQETIGDETSYYPHIGFWYGGNEELSHGEILKDGASMEGIQTNKSYTVCQIDPAQNLVASLTELSGTYTINPVGVNGSEWERSFEATFTGNEHIEGEVVITEFGFKNGKFYATFEVTGTARAYGFYLQPIIDGSVSRYYALPTNQYLAYTATSAATQTVEFNPLADEDVFYKAQKFRITPTAFNFSDKSMTVLRLAVTKDGTPVYHDMDYDDLKDGVYYKYEEPEE